MSLKRLINKYIDNLRNQCKTFRNFNVSTNKKNLILFTKLDLKKEEKKKYYEFIVSNVVAAIISRIV